MHGLYMDTLLTDGITTGSQPMYISAITLRSVCVSLKHQKHMPAAGRCLDSPHFQTRSREPQLYAASTRQASVVEKSKVSVWCLARKQC